MFVFIGALIGLIALGVIYEQISRRRDQRYPLAGRLVDVGGYRLHMTDSGEGGPSVVIIAGAGDSSYSWGHVAQHVAQFTRIVAYDRPGIGSSDAGPAPDAVGSVNELHTLLERAGVPAPYVLVGHSLGGLIARLYALRYPEQVAGLVLVDSTHEFLTTDEGFRKGFALVGVLLKVMRALSPIGLPRLLAQMGIIPMYSSERPYCQQQLSPEDYRRWVVIANRNCTGQAGINEVQATYAILEEAARQLKDGPAQPQFGNLPLAVLTNPGFGEGWIAKHRELASRSTNSIHWISDKKGHSLQFPRPDLVVNAIRHVVDQVVTSSRSA